MTAPRRHDTLRSISGRSMPGFSFAALRQKMAGKKKGKKIAHKDLFTDAAAASAVRSYMVMPGQPVWMDRNYAQFSLEAYVRNVIAHRAMGMVSGAAASIRLKLYSTDAILGRSEITHHPLIDLIRQANPTQAKSEFFHALYQYKLISGNAFIQAVGPKDTVPNELHLLRPDRMAIIAGKGTMPAGYRYTVNGNYTDFPVDKYTGKSQILHLKTFNPLNDWYGLSPVEAAAYSIDQHNQSGAWNQSLLQNGARPSGALVVRSESSGSGMLSEDQYNRVKLQIDEQFTGAINAGRPLLLEGGLDWREMSLTPKDMDFVEAKNSSARDIALAFGVPPQLLGIPGDNTYSNLQEARLALWEQTVVPLMWSTVDALNTWLVPMFGDHLELVADTDGISVLAMRNQAIWDRVQKADFLTVNEKRAAVGYGPLPKAADDEAAEPAGEVDDDDAMDGAVSKSALPDIFAKYNHNHDELGRFDFSDGTDEGQGGYVGDGANTTGDGSNAAALGALGAGATYSTQGGVVYDDQAAKDMSQHDWAPEQLDNAQKYGNNIAAIDKATGEPATRYVNPDTGKSVVINDVTNEVVHVGGEGYKYGPNSGDVPGAEMQPPKNVRPVSGGGNDGGGSLGRLVGGPHDFTNSRPDLPEMEE